MRQVSVEELEALVGKTEPPSEWMTIDQDRINAFADATNDFQFIHVDPEKAAESPFGGTIAHGFLTLSLIPHFLYKVCAAPEGTKMAINYGLNRLRFLNPVKVGSRVRAKFQLIGLDRRPNGSLMLTSNVEIEIEGEDKPALVAEFVHLYIIEG